MIRQLTKTPLMSDMARSQWVNWAEHVTKREEGDVLREVMERESEGGRPVGRPRKRGKDCAREYVQTLSVEEDWRETAQNRVVWRGAAAAARGLHDMQPAE